MSKNKKAKERRLSSLLRAGELPPIMELVDSLPPKKLISPLIRSFYQPQGLERWLAIRAFGRAVSRLAQEDMEQARIVMRRLMWSLNDESGGIGWGAPEAMAEAMAQNETLAREYARILLSYIWEDGNFLEHLPLRRGALWGLYRLAQTRPDIFREIEAWKILRPYLDDEDPESKALAIMAVAHSGQKELCQDLEKALSDDRGARIFTGQGFEDIVISKAAKAAMAKLSCL
ncbi:MAG: HEAT repeat domain-containing protein [Thermodesulfobacteria bacterium]|nr:HEAT repeat domain-containing protein [Thermodesulfobacteriota bacterium]